MSRAPSSNTAPATTAPEADGWKCNPAKVWRISNPIIVPYSAFLEKREGKRQTVTLGNGSPTLAVMTPLSDFIRRNQTALCFALVLLTSFFTYFFNYQNPQAFFWDENYHVASAQKYLNHVYFMEPHPPLGKLLIAAGEKLLNANPVDNQFIHTDYAQNPPDGFSFTGYRLFPALLAWMCAPLFFAAFLLITKRPVWAMLFTSLYTFDTAQIVHGRGAMLETTLLFFALVAMIGVLLLREQQDRRTVIWAAVLYGAGFGLAMVTKLFALILILLLPVALLLLWKHLKNVLLFLGVSAVAFVIPYCAVWETHFALGSRIVPDLPDNGFYQASADYKEILHDGTMLNPVHFSVMWRDSMDFVTHYQKGVPRLDLCKDDENGSPWFLWPIGGRTINYRWATAADGSYRYLMLVANPVIWLSALLGVVLAASLVLSELLGSGKALKERTFLWGYLALYTGFLAAVSQITRVMYLYHYFVPLAFGCILLALVWTEIEKFGPWKLTTERKTWALIALNVLIFFGFLVYRPLAYYEPMTDRQVEARNIFQLWELHCARCALQSPLVMRPGA